jgi:hypothetical protein
VTLKGLGVDGKDDRKMVLAALKKAGYGVAPKKLSEKARDGAQGGSAVAGPSSSKMSAVQVVVRRRQCAGRRLHHLMLF